MCSPLHAACCKHVNVLDLHWVSCKNVRNLIIKIFEEKNKFCNYGQTTTYKFVKVTVVNRICKSAVD